MDLNPYQSPRELGYFPPRTRSRWWDLLAYVGIALLVHAVGQAAVQAYIHLGLDWGKYFVPWPGWLITLAQLAAIAYVVVMISALALARRRRRRSLLVH